MAMAQSNRALNLTLRGFSPLFRTSVNLTTTSSAVSELQNDTVAGDDTEEARPAVELSPADNLIAGNFYSLIKDHHRKNPNFALNPVNPNVALPSLSFEFSNISAVQSLSAAVVRHVIEKCGAPRHGIPFPQTLAFFNWATSAPEPSQSLELFNEMIDLSGNSMSFGA